MQQVKLDHFDVCVVGAGVIGLAIAQVQAAKQRSVLILESEKQFGNGISSRNSEVIHAGIYYPAGSLKARLCVEGRHRLYQYCETHGVAHRRLGKLIVAGSEAQAGELEQLQRKAVANEVEDLRRVSSTQLKQLEPNVAGQEALLSPSTGIIDCHGYMTALLADIESCQGMLCLDTRFAGASVHPDGFMVSAVSVGEPYRFVCTHLINAAGLSAQRVAALIDGLDAAAIPQLYYCKGSYFSLSGRSPFNRLIYPMPEPNTTGLGVHATLDLGGQVRFGPDTEYLDHEDYQVNEQKREVFAEAIRRYYPGLDASRLTPAYAGIRPKTQAPGAQATDFSIDQALPGLINLFGIESPGLTSSLAVAHYVDNMLNN